MVSIWLSIAVCVALFTAYLACLVVALRLQKRRNDRKLTRVRAQRDDARAAVRKLEQQAVDAEFTEIVRNLAQRRGGEGR